MGNIWILQNITRQGENFVWSRFYKELAVGTGVGLRLNFTFLVVLCDVGFKLYDPSYPMGERLFPNTMWEPILNIGLGYPF